MGNPNQWNNAGAGIVQGLGSLAEGYMINRKNQSELDERKKLRKGAYGLYTTLLDGINQTVQKYQAQPEETTPELDDNNSITSIKPATVDGSTEIKSKRIGIQDLYKTYDEGRAELVNKYGEEGKVYAEYLKDNFARILDDPSKKLIEYNGGLIEYDKVTKKMRVIKPEKLPKEEVKKYNLRELGGMTVSDIEQMEDGKKFMENNFWGFSPEVQKELETKYPYLKEDETSSTSNRRVRRSGVTTESNSLLDSRNIDNVVDVFDNEKKLTTLSKSDKEAYLKQKRELADRLSLTPEELVEFSNEYVNAHGDKGKRLTTQKYKDIQKSRTEKAVKTLAEMGMDKEWQNSLYNYDTSTQVGLEKLYAKINEMYSVLGDNFSKLDSKDTRQTYYNAISMVNEVLESKGLPLLKLKDE